MLFPPDQPLPYRIEVSRGGFIKRDPHGRIDFISPAPCPFNYGSIPGVQGDDGEPMDVVVLGPRLPLGAEGEAPLRGRVRFLDAGVRDDKWVLSSAPLGRRDRLRLWLFFQTYARLKALARPHRGPTRFEGMAIFSRKKNP